jgi:hypothetical protein
MPLIVNDYGTRIILVVEEEGEPLDISTATNLQYEFTRPDGTVLTVSAGFETDGEDGRLLYTTVNGNINTVGLWKVRASFTMGSWVGRSRQVVLRVDG